MASLCAVVAVRNEAAYLPTLLRYLRDQGAGVILIDNGSSDGSREIAAAHRGAPVIEMVDLAYDGAFNLSAQLEAKAAIIGRVRHDWIVHQDADEILQSAIDGETLSDLTARADAMGLAGIDFDEFAFLPDSPAGYSNGEYLENGSRYYFFQPRSNRLNRMFKRNHFRGFEGGGHNVLGVTPNELLTGQILRHYLVLDRQHARDKYVDRVFGQDDLEKGWHKRRIEISPSDLEFDADWPRLKQLTTSASRAFDRSEPHNTHYWQWRKP